MILVCSLTLLFSTGVMGSIQQPPQTPFPQLGHEIAAIVEKNFYDAQRAEAWYQAHQDYADKIEDVQAFEEQTYTALDALHSSHTAYYRPTDLSYMGLLSIFEAVLRPEGVWYDSIGVDLVRQPQGYFVRTVFAGGPAEKAGLLRGDLLLSADNRPYTPISVRRAR